MHRKIRAVVQASALDEAVEKAVDGLEAAMGEGKVADGTLRTLTGEYESNAPFGPSTYFNDDRDRAGYRTTSSDGIDDLDEALQDMDQHGSPFIFTIDEHETGITATPIPSEPAYESLRETLETKDDPHWVVAFDLRYDFDATPHKPHEILHNSSSEQ